MSAELLSNTSVVAAGDTLLLDIPLGGWFCEKEITPLSRAVAGFLGTKAVQEAVGGAFPAEKQDAAAQVASELLSDAHRTEKGRRATRLRVVADILSHTVSIGVGDDEPEAYVNDGRENSVLSPASDDLDPEEGLSVLGVNGYGNFIIEALADGTHIETVDPDQVDPADKTAKYRVADLRAVA